MVQFEDCAPDLAKKIAIVLKEYQFGAFDVAFQEVDLGLVLHKSIEIDEGYVDSSTGRNIDD